MGIKIYTDEIVNIGEYCPYCGSEAVGESCCGENHFERGFEMEDGEVYLEWTDRVEVIQGSKPLTEEQQLSKDADLKYESANDK